MAFYEHATLFVEISLKRIVDLILAGISCILLFIPIILISLSIFFTSKGKVLYWSNRIGKNNQIFKMPKFRTMRVDTPEVATHMLTNPQSYLTKIGSLLRRSSMDELPQIWSIFVGDMSFVGPRPALFNQEDLIKLRTECGVHEIIPGLTGWAQINGRDELSITEKVLLDRYYLDNQSLLFDVVIIIRTLFKIVRKDGIMH